MRIWKLLLLFVVLSGKEADGQGTILWTWHGDQNLFQGSFEVTDGDMLPSSGFHSPLFTNSITISSLDGMIYHATDSIDVTIGRCNGSQLSLTLILYNTSVPSRLSSTVEPGQVSFITESADLPQGHNGETGVWTFERIPESSSVALLAIGAVASRVRSLKE